MMLFLYFWLNIYTSSKREPEISTSFFVFPLSMTGPTLCDYLCIIYTYLLDHQGRFWNYIHQNNTDKLFCLCIELLYACSCNIKNIAYICILCSTLFPFTSLIQSEYCSPVLRLHSQTFKDLIFSMASSLIAVLKSAIRTLFIMIPWVLVTLQAFLPRTSVHPLFLRSFSAFSLLIVKIAKSPLERHLMKLIGYWPILSIRMFKSLRITSVGTSFKIAFCSAFFNQTSTSRSLLMDDLYNVRDDEVGVVPWKRFAYILGLVSFWEWRGGVWCTDWFAIVALTMVKFSSIRWWRFVALKEIFWTASRIYFCFGSSCTFWRYVDMSFSRVSTNVIRELSLF